MPKRSQLSRRQFVGSALSAATVSSVPIPSSCCRHGDTARTRPILTGKMRAFFWLISLPTPSYTTFQCARSRSLKGFGERGDRPMSTRASRRWRGCSNPMGG